MQKYQYFGPPFTVQLDNRSILLRPGSLVDLEASDVEVVLSMKDGLRLVPIPVPKWIIPSSIPVEPKPISEEKIIEGEDNGILLEEDVEKEDPVEEWKPKKKKKKNKKKGQNDAPSSNEEG